MKNIISQNHPESLLFSPWEVWRAILVSTVCSPALSLHSQKLSGGRDTESLAGHTPHKVTAIRRLLRKQIHAAFMLRYAGIPTGNSRSTTRSNRNRIHVVRNVCVAWWTTCLLEWVPLGLTIWSFSDAFFNNFVLHQESSAKHPRVRRRNAAMYRICEVCATQHWQIWLWDTSSMTGMKSDHRKT